MRNEVKITEEIELDNSQSYYEFCKLFKMLIQPKRTTFQYFRIQTQLEKIFLNSSSCNVIPENKYITIRDAFDEKTNSKNEFYRLNKINIIGWFKKCLPLLTRISMERMGGIKSFENHPGLNEGYASFLNVLSETMVNSFSNNCEPNFKYGNNFISLEQPWFAYKLVKEFIQQSSIFLLPLNTFDFSCEWLKNAEFWKMLVISVPPTNSHNMMAPIAYSKISNFTQERESSHLQMNANSDNIIDDIRRDVNSNDSLSSETLTDEEKIRLQKNTPIYYVGSFTNFTDLAVFTLLLQSHQNLTTESLGWLVSYIYKYYESSLNYLKRLQASEIICEKVKKIQQKVYMLRSIHEKESKNENKGGLMVGRITNISKNIINALKNLYKKSAKTQTDDNQVGITHRFTENIDIIATINDIQYTGMYYLSPETGILSLDGATDVINQQGIIQNSILSRMLSFIAKLPHDIKTIKKIITLVMISTNLTYVEAFMNPDILSSKNVYCEKKKSIVSENNIYNDIYNSVDAALKLLCQIGCSSCGKSYSFELHRCEKDIKMKTVTNQFLLKRIIYILDDIFYDHCKSFNKVLHQIASKIDIHLGLIVMHIIFIVCSPVPQNIQELENPATNSTTGSIFPISQSSKIFSLKQGFVESLLNNFTKIIIYRSIDISLLFDQVYIEELVLLLNFINIFHNETSWRLGLAPMLDIIDRSIQFNPEKVRKQKLPCCLMFVERIRNNEISFEQLFFEANESGSTRRSEVSQNQQAHLKEKCELFYGSFSVLVAKSFRRLRIFLELSLPGFFPHKNIFSNIMSLGYCSQLTTIYLIEVAFFVHKLTLGIKPLSHTILEIFAQNDPTNDNYSNTEEKTSPWQFETANYLISWADALTTSIFMFSDQQELTECSMIHAAFLVLLEITEFIFKTCEIAETKNKFSDTTKSPSSTFKPQSSTNSSPNLFLPNSKNSSVRSNSNRDSENIFTQNYTAKSQKWISVIITYVFKLYTKVRNSNKKIKVNNTWDYEKWNYIRKILLEQITHIKTFYETSIMTVDCFDERSKLFHNYDNDFLSYLFIRVNGLHQLPFIALSRLAYKTDQTQAVALIVLTWNIMLDYNQSIRSCAGINAKDAIL